MDRLFLGGEAGPLLDELPLPDRPALDRLLSEQYRWLGQEKKGFLRFREPAEAMACRRARFLDLAGSVVRIGAAAELGVGERQELEERLRCFMPWRKGPFSVFGIDIDAEWRSERKWDRLLPELPELTGKRVADIGCNNGYYMFRMAHHEPRLVLGFEPYVQHYFAFQALNRMAGLENLAVLPLGVEHIGLFAGCFDVIFLMGIIYHRPSPFEMLRQLLGALRPGGTLVVESQAIPGEEPLALFPRDRYAKVPGTYFVPTGSCLVNWLERAGFTDVRLFCSHPMSSAEQRRTDWMGFESYADFLDPADQTRTVEGYPAPLRVFVKAARPG